MTTSRPAVPCPPRLGVSPRRLDANAGGQSVERVDCRTECNVGTAAAVPPPGRRQPWGATAPASARQGHGVRSSTRRATRPSSSRRSARGGGDEDARWPSVSAAPHPRRRVLAHDDLSLSVSELARARPPRALRRPARLQPGAEDGPRRARLPAGGRVEETARWRRARRATRSARPRVEVAGHRGLRRQPAAVPTVPLALLDVGRRASAARSAPRCPQRIETMVAEGALGQEGRARVLRVRALSAQGSTRTPEPNV